MTVLPEKKLEMFFFSLPSSHQQADVPLSPD